MCAAILGPMDPLAVPLPHGTEVMTRVDRLVGEQRVHRKPRRSSSAGAIPMSEHWLVTTTDQRVAHDDAAGTPASYARTTGDATHRHQYVGLDLVAQRDLG